MNDPLYTDCPVCKARMSEPCDWTGWNHFTPHPDFHHERVDAANAPAVTDASISEPAYDKACEAAMDEVT